MNVAKWVALMLVLAVPLLAVWHTALSLLVRPFGTRLPLFPLPLKRLSAAVRLLSRREYIIIEGALGWGAGTWFLMTLSNFAYSKVAGGIGVHETLGSFLGGLAIFMVGGLGWGGATWRQPYLHDGGCSIAPEGRN